MTWVEILPPFESLFRRHGMESASAFLDWTGILVNRHRHRQVEQVTLGDATYFLKKETAVSWRDRLRNAWDGFGWCATAVREGATLQALRRAGVGCPEVIALGEDDKRAFVLMRDETGKRDLRTVLAEMHDPRDRHRLADALGRELARMHDAGFDHPDLFAKHILTDGSRFCILDWQRGCYQKRVSWRLRCRDLALLNATLLSALANDRLRLRCLRAYCRATQLDAPPLARLARQIRVVSERLGGLRRIRDLAQMPAPAGDQAFVPLRGGELLVVRSYADRLGTRWADGWQKMVDDAAHPWDLLTALACTVGADKVTRQACPCATASWEIPRLAHTLFRLQRFGVPAQRLLAVGHSGDKVHLLAESPKVTSFAEAFAKATGPERSRWLRSAGEVVRGIHDAGYYLPTGETWERRLGVSEGGDVMLMHVEPLPRGDVAWQELAPLEFHAPTLRLSRAEQMRFLSGYLQRNSEHALLLAGQRSGERRVA